MSEDELIHGIMNHAAEYGTDENAERNANIAAWWDDIGRQQYEAWNNLHNARQLARDCGNVVWRWAKEYGKKRSA